MGGIKKARYDRKFLGVCGGIAHSYGLNPTMVRVATAVLAVVIPGVSVVPTLFVYVLLALILPTSATY